MERPRKVITIRKRSNHSYLGGGKVKKEFRDSFLKKITFCSKHFDLNDDTHDVKEKVIMGFMSSDYLIGRSLAISIRALRDAFRLERRL